MPDKKPHPDDSPPDGSDAPEGPDAAPDYPLDDRLLLETPAQYTALFHDVRQQIVRLLTERAATTTELAETLGRPKGTVGHHLKVLADAGLVRVVRTKRVRALEARYYGRTARLFLFHPTHEAAGEPRRTLERAADALESVPPDGGRVVCGARHAVISPERADEWEQRIEALLVEFASQPRDGDIDHLLTIALSPTGESRLPQADA